jgi:methylated-DNA-[protein]-cysteine S-methyltransferase
MDVTMKTSDGQTIEAATSGTVDDGDIPNRPPPSKSSETGVDLIVVASRPNVDPCDVACEAMPAHLLGDLTPRESDWLLDHTTGCRYCANELDHYEQATDALDQLHEHLLVDATPPPFPSMLGKRRAGYARLESPIGPLFVAASEEGVCEIDFAEGETEDVFRRRLAARGFDPRPLPEGCESGAEWAVLVDAAAQLREYFGRRRHDFDLPLDFTGVTPFTRDVLEATAGVPFGRLDTYRGIASRVGRPSATRAVGNALGRNPIPVVVPCHRIIRSDATLGGYTGGLQIKQHLLALEGVTLT